MSFQDQLRGDEGLIINDIIELPEAPRLQLADVYRYAYRRKVAADPRFRPRIDTCLPTAMRLWMSG
jgi:hypothetical protein